MNSREAQTTLVLGLGKTGLACVDWLAGRGESLRVADSRPFPPGLVELRERHPGIDPVLGQFGSDLLDGISRVVVSPGLSLDLPIIKAARSHGLPIIGDIDLFASEVAAPVIAVTGSNGKSTVVTLLASMCEAAGIHVELGGNVGTAVLELLKRPVPQYYILELSSFQLDTLQNLRLKAACVLNVSADHMDRYPSLDAYAASKARIYKDCELAVVNNDDPLVSGMGANAPSTVGFGLTPPRSGEWGVIMDAGEFWLMRGEHRLLPTSEMKLPGTHNQANALAALALGDSMGLPVAAMVKALKNFAGLAHRTEFVHEHAGVRWYDDSKATNVGATVAALAGMQRPLVLIAGGQGKGQDFSPLGLAAKGQLRAALLLGEDAPLIEDVFAHILNGSTPVRRVASMDDAVRSAAELAQAGDAVLLSPACASFDMFDGFEARGDAFAGAARRLAT